MKIAATLVATISQASANSIPINGRFPGWTAGVNRVDIEIELFIDLLCADCARGDPVFDEFMRSEWNGRTVAEQVGIKITPFPLPYHAHAFEVAQLVPFWINKFIDSKGSDEAKMNAYKDFCFKNYNQVLNDNLGKADFQASWSKQVAAEFKIPEAEVAAAYGTDDKYHTSDATRAFWKYGAAKGVFGTPSAFVNGSKLDEVPTTVADWTALLN